MSKPTPEFIAVLKRVMAGYGKTLPEAPVVLAWWEALAPFTAQIIGQAFSDYAIEKPDFAPVPNSIAARCRLLDGRPGAEEAWSIALTSRDESNTVVWTSECAEAFAQCSPILDLGDEVGARMAFKEAYTRLVSHARAASLPARWSASLGWDMTRREAVLTRASHAGLLPAPQVAALLPPPAGAPTHDEKARAQLATIRQMLADSEADKERRRVEAAERQRAEDEEWKRETSRRVDEYMARNP